jgi:hypothetical protein
VTAIHLYTRLVGCAVVAQNFTITAKDDLAILALPPIELPGKTTIVLVR